MVNPVLFNPQWQHNFVSTEDGVRLHYVEVGPRDGVPVVMVHGWADFWFGWRYQMRALSPKYRVIVPDMRGYGRSSAPQSVEAYGTKKNADDLAALLDALDIPSAVFLGHDWGGVFVWRMCLFHPERVIAVCSVCTPYFPPRKEYVPTELLVKLVPEFEYQLWLSDSETAGKTLDKSPERLFRALFRRPDEWIAYQLPLPELISNAGTDLEHPVYEDLPTLMSEEELQFYVQQYAKTGFVSACQAYAAGRINFESELELPVTVPHRALYIAAGEDPVLKPEMAGDMLVLVPNLSPAFVKDAGHWVLTEQKEEVNKVLLEWLATVEEQ